MREINASELSKILKEHKRWCDTDEEEGEKADLSHANLRGAVAVFDDVGWNVEIIRQEHDYQKTMSKIEKAGFPSFLAERLMLGK